MGQAPNRLKYPFYQARMAALDELEQMARAIMHEHPRLEEFVIAGGEAFFTERSKPAALHLHRRAYLKPLLDYIEKWDESMYLTCWSLRFAAKGPIHYMSERVGASTWFRRHYCVVDKLKFTKRLAG